MRGSEVSVPEGPHALRSTDSLSLNRSFSVADMLQCNICVYAWPSIPRLYSKEDDDLHRAIHVASE